MSEPATRTVKCPICRKPVALDAPEMPFCSERCRLLDLGAWASGEYRISSPILDPELLEEVEQSQLNAHRAAEEGRERKR